MRRGEMLGKMIALAANAHAGQMDRGGQPYILHPLTVLHMLKTDDEELQSIAVLHDVVEDTKTTYQELRDAGATERVIRGVAALTKVPGESYEEYKQKVFDNADAMAVKKCDLRHNSDLRRLKGITEKDVARMVKYNTFYLEICAKEQEKKS